MKRAMSLEEIKERNREIWRLKEMRRRMESKAARQNATKSRKFHKILRREKLRKQKAEIETLTKDDPEAALEKLKELDYIRVKERMSLRHRKSKWAHLQGLRVKHDKTSKIALQENKNLHQELTKKMKTGEQSNSDDDDDDDENSQKSNFNKDNNQDDKDEGGFIKLKQYWDKVNNEKLKLKQKEEQTSPMKSTKSNISKHKKILNNNDKMLYDKTESSNCENSETDEVKFKEIKLSEIENKSSDNESSDDCIETKEDFDIDDMFNEAKNMLKTKVKRKLEEIDSQEIKKSNKKKKNNTKDFELLIEHNFTNENVDEEELLNEVSSKNLDEKNNDPNKNNILDILLNDKDQKCNPKDNKKTNSNKDIIDPKAFMQINTKKLSSIKTDSSSCGQEVLDDDEEELDEDEENPEEYIQDALADDYLVDEFKSAKEDAINQSKPEEISLTMPGWGSWCGPGIEVSKRKAKRMRNRRSRFVQPRKDSNMGNVIYNEKSDMHENLRKVMVSDLPYPFNSVKDFEASVRAPVGRTFLPEHVHRKLVVEPVTTKLGTVIEPMDEDALLKKKYKNNKRDMTEEISPKKAKYKKKSKL